MPYRKGTPWGRLKPPEFAQLDWGDPINRGLVGRWLFGGARARIDDMTGRNPMRGNSGVTDVPGPFGGRAIQFDGTTGFTRNSFQGVRPIVTTPPFSYVAWACWTDSTKAHDIIFTQDEAGNVDYYGIFINATSGLFAAVNRDSGGTHTATSTAAATVGYWYQVVGVWASTSDRRIYVNGRLEGTDTTASTPTAANLDSTTFGALNRLTVAYGTGKMDNASIYNRALSTAEIERLFNEPFAGIVPNRRRIISTPPNSPQAGAMMQVF